MLVPTISSFFHAKERKERFLVEAPKEKCGEREKFPSLEFFLYFLFLEFVSFPFLFARRCHVFLTEEKRREMEQRRNTERESKNE